MQKLIAWLQGATIDLSASLVFFSDETFEFPEIHQQRF